MGEVHDRSRSTDRSRPPAALSEADRARRPLDHGPPTAVSARRAPRAWLLLLSVLAAGLLLDLGTKYWTFATVAGEPVVLDRERLLAEPGHQPIPFHDGVAVLPGRLLDLRLVVNHGAVFGLGAERRAFFIAFTLIALAAGLVVFGFFTTARHRLAHVALALVLAGGLGNLYDRIVYGVVRDFLHMLPGWNLPFGLRWPQWFNGSPEIFPWVFNIADVMLLTGMVLLMIHINRLEGRQTRRSAEGRGPRGP